jgi:hypothetical protein
LPSITDWPTKIEWDLTKIHFAFRNDSHAFACRGGRAAGSTGVGKGLELGIDAEVAVSLSTEAAALVSSSEAVTRRDRTAVVCAEAAEANNATSNADLKNDFVLQEIVMFM